MSVRCFIAIELPDEVRTLFGRVGSTVRQVDGRWHDEKWVPQDNLHVTLKFVGHIDEQSVETLVRACGREIAAIPRFELSAEKIRAVPGPGRARMLWGAFLDPTGLCGALAGAAERAALDVGVEPETRTFKPHVTLVRARSAHAIAPEALDAGNKLLSAANEVVSVSAATVFRSTLSRSGPTYTALALCPLWG